MDKSSECDKIYKELEEWFGRLKNAYESSEITEDEGRNLAELSRMILNHLTRKLPHSIAERMVSTVGGKVLELQQDRWLEEGIQIGEERGIKIGKKEGEERMSRLIKAIPQDSKDYELALNSTEKVRQKLYEKYGL